MANIVHAEFVIGGSEEARKVFLNTTRFVKKERSKELREDLTLVSGFFNGFIAPREGKEIDLDKLKKDKYTKKDYPAISELTLAQKTKLLDCSVQVYTEYDEDTIIHEIYNKGRLTKMEKKTKAELDAMDYVAKLYQKKLEKKGRWRFGLTKEDYDLAKQCIEEAEKKYGVKLK